MIAQSRDLQDRKTALDFADVVQSLERLALLLILTACDIRAVGPGVWTGWKGSLLRSLYYATEPLLSGGHSQVSRDRASRRRKDVLAEALADWPQAERDAYLGRHYDLLAARRAPRQVAHAELIRAADRGRQALAAAIRTRAFEAITEVTFFAPDHPRLLSLIAGACTMAGANIVDAQIYTTTDGQALDTRSRSRANSTTMPTRNGGRGRSAT